jgi:hypothetical protein
VRGFTLQKRPDTPNEDRWAISNDGLAAAVSDGASVSYDPAPWADLLVQDFVAGADLTEAWLEGATARYRAGYDPESMDWMRAGAFERGSFASLLGLRFQPASPIAEVSGVGDSLLAITRRGEVIRSWPYRDADEFDASPQLLATVGAENAILFEQMPRLPSIKLDLTDLNADAVLLMTDALGHWLLKNADAAGQLIDIRDEGQFAAWVEAQRATGELRRDDTTLIVVPV